METCQRVQMHQDTTTKKSRLIIAPFLAQKVTESYKSSRSKRRWLNIIKKKETVIKKTVTQQEQILLFHMSKGKVYSLYDKLVQTENTTADSLSTKSNLIIKQL